MVQTAKWRHWAFLNTNSPNFISQIPGSKRKENQAWGLLDSSATQPLEDKKKSSYFFTKWTKDWDINSNRKIWWRKLKLAWISTFSFLWTIWMTCPKYRQKFKTWVSVNGGYLRHNCRVTTRVKQPIMIYSFIFFISSSLYHQQKHE